MIDTPSPYLGELPDETFAVRLPAVVAEQVRDLAEVHTGGDVGVMISRLIRRQLDPVQAAIEDMSQN